MTVPSPGDTLARTFVPICGCREYKADHVEEDWTSARLLRQVRLCPLTSSLSSDTYLLRRITTVMDAFTLISDILFSEDPSSSDLPVDEESSKGNGTYCVIA
jgi:hypothetical protein